MRTGERVIGLDFGERRIGVAASDALGVTAQVVTVIERTSLAEDVARIGEIAERRRAGKIVLGLPLNMDGSMSPQGRRVRRFANRLRRELELEVELWDERLSTMEAERMLIEAGESRAARRASRDGVAAAIILQGYMEAHRRSSTE